MRPVVLYVDYENVRYWQLHEFGMKPAEFNVVRLGQIIVDRRHEASLLLQVRTYRGSPSARFDRRRFNRQRRWLARNMTDSRFVFIDRPLKYPKPGEAFPPVEKGIDVALAIDLVMHPLRLPDAAAVLVTRDTDLEPALEAFVSLANGKTPIEVVSCGEATRLHLASRMRPWCHYLTREDFERIRED
jgi:NYN domain